MISIADDPDYSDETDDVDNSNAVMLAEKFKALDNWIVSGGVLPKEWIKS